MATLLYCTNCAKTLVNSDETNWGGSYKCILDNNKKNLRQSDFFLAQCKSCKNDMRVQEGCYAICDACLNKQEKSSTLIIADDPYDPARAGADKSVVAKYFNSLYHTEPVKMSAIKGKSLFRWAAVRNVRNDDLVIVNQELVSNGIVLATNEIDARVRVGIELATNHSTTNLDDVEVVVVSF